MRRLTKDVALSRYRACNLLVVCGLKGCQQPRHVRLIDRCFPWLRSKTTCQMSEYFTLSAYSETVNN